MIEDAVKDAEILRTTRDNGDTCWSRIAGCGATEIHVRIRPRSRGGFEAQVREIYRKLGAMLHEEGVTLAAVINERVFFSHLEAQVEPFRRYRDELYSRSGTARPATTFLNQPPCGSGAELELQAMILFAEDPSTMVIRDLDLEEPAVGKIVSFRGYDHVYLHNLTGGLSGDDLEYAEQTELVFGKSVKALQSAGMTFDDVIRTWIFLSEMERDYDDLNRVRNTFFDRIGLSCIPASTGIQAGVYPCDRHGSMDLYALRARQAVEKTQMRADTLDEAWKYGSAFARGIRVEREDRRVLYLSGTASIDTRGEVVHVNDIEGQARRMLINVEELLAASGAGTVDIIRATTYLKHAEDYETLRRVFAEKGFPAAVPHTICHADVCRPDWLVEIEVTAIQPART